MLVIPIKEAGAEARDGCHKPRYYGPDATSPANTA